MKTPGSCHLLLVAVAYLGAVQGVYGADASSLASKVQPPSATAYMKGRLELRLAAEPPDGAMDLTGLKLSFCAVRLPGAPSYTTLPASGAAVGSSNELSLLGDYSQGLCGVRVQSVSKLHDGEWTLRAVFSGDKSYTAVASASVSVMEFGDAMVPEKPSLTESGNDFTLRLVLLESGLKLSACAVITPWPKDVKLPEGASSDDPRLRYFPGTGANAGTLDQGWCAVAVKGVRAEDTGRWILEATVKDTGVVRRGSTTVTVLTRAMAVAPSSQMIAEQAETAVMRLVFANRTQQAPAAQWAACQAVTPDGSVLQLSGTGPRTPTGTGSVDVRLSGPAGTECGVRVGPLVASTHAGRWTLVGVADGANRSASAMLFVQEPYHPAGAKEVSVALGTRGQPLACGPDEALFCELRDPEGAVAATFTGPCRHTLERVRAVHQGNWTCSALLKDYSDALNDTVVLALAEPVHVVTGVLAPAVRAGRAAGQVQDQEQEPLVLRCRLAGTRPCPNALQYCRMDSPSGQRHMLKDGVVAAGRYSYAGEGFYRCDCSMAISRPLAPEDYGVWRCVMGFSYARRGGLIALTRTAVEGGGDRTARDVVSDVGLEAIRAPADGVVSPGAAVTVGCRAPHALSYCWLWTPRGERLSVLEGYNPDDGQLRYAGLGLELGECGVLIPAASPANHSGTWRCGVGLVGQGGPTLDLEVPVELVVSESLMVPLEETVSSAKGRAATLGCRTQQGDALDYCRFQRPDGVSIHLADAGVRTEGTSSELSYRFLGDGGGLAGGYCRLTISSVADEDFGQWVCAVRVAGEVRGREQTASMVLEPAGGDIADAGLIGGTVAAVAVVLAAASYVAYRRFGLRPRQRRARSSPSVSSSQTSDAPIALHQEAGAWASDTSPASAAAESRRTTRSSARAVATMLPSTRLPARMRSARTSARTPAGSSSRTSSRAAVSEAISLEPLPRPAAPDTSVLPAAASDYSSGSEIDMFPIRKSQ